MKVVVMGGSGLIGAKLVEVLRGQGHDVLSASPRSGVNSISGEGLDAALRGAHVVVDATNSPSLDPRVARDFFETSGRNLVAAANNASVAHYVVLSIVGVDRLQSGYFQAKAAQEALVSASDLPHTIVRATQFFEFIHRIVCSGATGDTVRLPPALMQPLAADDAVDALADIGRAQPLNDIVEVAGPEAMALTELARELLSARERPCRVVADASALYFGASLEERSLIPGPAARLAQNTFGDWLRRMIPPG